jgi:hypothetical protein
MLERALPRALRLENKPSVRRGTAVPRARSTQSASIRPRLYATRKGRARCPHRAPSNRTQQGEDTAPSRPPPGAVRTPRPTEPRFAEFSDKLQEDLGQDKDRSG